MNNLYQENTLMRFFQIGPGVASSQAWLDAAGTAASNLISGKEALWQGSWDGLMNSILGEGQFGESHWQLSRVKQAYYQFVRPILPANLRAILRTKLLSKGQIQFTLNWPVEDHYVWFMFEVATQLMVRNHLDVIPHISFWPSGKRFAFVITHDIETGLGQNFVRKIAALDEKYGFRSSFNFIPEKYPVDLNLISELKERGFEVGVHGLKHDGMLFSSRVVFDERVKKINQYLKQWDAVGFRSPMTHRNPEWMQALEVEYDSSFFDTDPYEPIPGGTMSIWPFQLGRFVELPYTLVQDHTLMVTLGETTPRLWLEKVDFIKQYCGMALVNAHPDYLLTPTHLMIYEDFLRQMSQMNDYWHALPRDVARWWKKRAQFNVDDGFDNLQASLPGATICSIRLVKNGIEIGL